MLHTHVLFVQCTIKSESNACVIAFVVIIVRFIVTRQQHVYVNGKRSSLCVVSAAYYEIGL